MDNGKITIAGKLSDIRNSGTFSTILEEADDRSEYVKDSAELAAENVLNNGADTASSSTAVENVENEVNLDGVQKAKKKIIKKPKVLIEEEGNILFVFFVLGFFKIT